VFILYAERNQLIVKRREPVTSGSVNVCHARFLFSSDWEGLTRTAVFRAGGESRSVLLDESGVCAVPWEALRVPGYRLTAGVCGRRGETIVLPTIWAELGTVLEGVSPGEDARPPSPDLWQQALAGKGDTLDYTTDGELGLFSGDRLLSAVPISGGGGEGGTSDHRMLSHRDDVDQHPIGAITGLEEALQSIPLPMTAEQLRKILMNGV